MAIEKMKLVRVDGLLKNLDSVIYNCCLDGNFHPEPAIQHMSGSLGYITLSEDNPYTSHEQKMEELYQLETLNNGRPLRETRAQLARVPDLFRYNAALAMARRDSVITFQTGAA